MIFENYEVPDNPLEEMIERTKSIDWTQTIFDFDINHMLENPPNKNQDIDRATVKRSTLWLHDRNITASIIYPPSGGMGWHTNSSNPGLRAYLSWSENGNSGMGWVRDEQVVLDYDKPGWNIRIFQVPSWHCVFARCWRCSLGVKLNQSGFVSYERIS
jgi:hypothetical protein